jgi:hypothetical protein
MRKFAYSGLVFSLCLATATAQTIFMDGISVSNDYIRNIGLVDMAGWNTDYTGAVRHLGVSLGQLSGIEPQTGAVITNSQNLIPLTVRSLTARTAINGNGVGITNVNAETLDGLHAASFATGTPVYAEADPIFGAWLGTNTYVTTEADPVWASEKSLYATGTPLYGYTETDPLFATWLGTNAYVKTETDPVWNAQKANYATGTPVYVETDPQWTNAKASGFTLSGALTMADPNIRRDVDTDQISVVGGSDWNRGAMLQLGGNNAGGDIANGSAQILMNDFDSRFRLRERSSWRDGFTFHGNGRLVAPYATETTNNDYIVNLGALRSLFSTGTPVYVETDPVWTSASNLYLMTNDLPVRAGTALVTGQLTSVTFDGAFSTAPVVVGTFNTNGVGINQLAQIEMIESTTAGFTFQVRTGSGITTNGYGINWIAR